MRIPQVFYPRESHFFSDVELPAAVWFFVMMYFVSELKK